jgi:hypothetical protein
MIGAVNVDRASQFLVLVVLVDYLVIVDGSWFLGESEADHSQLIWSRVQRNHVIQGAIKLTHAENLVSIQNNWVVNLI